MAAVNWFCLVLAFAFINNYVCIKVDPNGIPNGNYTTNNLNGQQTILPYKKSTLLATATATATATTTSSISSNNNNESNNFTLLGDTELSASERTRRLIPYMAFYVPVSELPINKQYANKNNIHANKQQLMARPSATGATSGSSNSHTPIPSQYVHHSGIEYLPAPGPSAGPLSHISSSSGPSAQPFYQTSAGGLDIYHHHHHDFAGQQHQQPQQQFHLLPPIAGHAHPHLQPPGPPGPSATGLPPVSSLVGVGHGKGNGVINNHNHNAFVSFKEVNPIRQKTVQHFPPLSSTAATSSSASASAAYENIRQTSSVIKQKHRGISSGSNSGGNAAVQYRPRTKQSKINLTPFTPSNSVPGNFVPIVYTPVNSNNNNNNNILNSQALGIAGTGGGLVASDIDDSSYNQQFQQQQQQHHQQQKPQQIAIEYSSGLLPPPSPTAGSVTSLPIDIQPVPQRHRYQQQHHQRNHHNPKQQSQYYSVTTSPVNIDLTHDVVAAGGGLSVGADSLDTAHHNYHHHSSPHNIDAIRPAKPQYNNYVIDEPKQSLDDEQQQQQQYQQQKSQHQLELLKPTLGPPSHAFILVTTAAPFLHEPAVTQENYGSSLRPPYKNKPKIRLQPVLKENNVNYATIREQNPTRRPQIVSITPTTKSHVPQQEDETPKYVYVKEEFGQKLSATATGTGAAAGTGGAVKLKPSNKYESDDNQIPQQHYHHHHHQQQQQQQHEDNITLQPLAPRQPVTPHHHHHQQQHEQEEEQHDNVAVTGIESTPPKTILADPNELPDIRTSSLAEILHKLQESNHLPHTLTPDNIDNSIKTLIRILNNLKQTQTIVANPPQHHETPAHPPPSSPDYDYTTGSEEDQQQPQAHDISLLKPTVPNKHPGPSTGRPGIDYPNYAEIPQTSFDCSEQRYKGFFGDPETNCQVWHYCDLNGGKASFLCPNGTIFSQIALTCDWWFNVKCATTPQLYVLNERLYKYILPFTPKFPEDYSGPIVDKYLAMKFQEMEEKMRLEKEKALQEEAEAAAKKSEEADETISEDSKEDNHLEETTTQDKPNKHLKSHTPSQHHKHESVNSIVSEQSSERNLLIDDEVDDISQRGSIDNFESSTIAALTATVKPDITSFSLKPIIVSSTLGPDYDEEQLQRHDNEKRSNEKPNEELEVEIENKTKTTAAAAAATATTSTVADAVTEATVSIPTVASTNRMHITVEKVDVIEIKPDGATGHLIRDMLMNSKQTTK
ncbi:uncharacterized protein ACRADG_013117 isoform 4-T6 [Cochliomyia hominivorax]